MKNKILFHLPYQPDRNKASASQIRPYKMIDAFKSIGYEVLVVMGVSKVRKAQIFEIKRRIKDGEVFDFMYSESSTMPTLLTETHHLPIYPFLDFGFIRFCRNNGIPVGLFYRDIHWKFEHYELGKYSYKKMISILFYKLDLKLYKRYIDILYLPSIETAKYIPELQGMSIEPLPPGNELINASSYIYKANKGIIRFLYVGGIGELYNLKLFLNEIINQPSKKFHVTICTRESDYIKVKKDYETFFNAENVDLVHLHGIDLLELYQKSDISCIFVKPTPYWEFVVPFKLFEYVAHKNPILAVNGTAVGTFVKDNNIGWSIDFNETALNSFLEHLFENFTEEKREFFLENLNRVSKTSTWTARAKFVSNSLLKKKVIMNQALNQ